MPSECNVIGSEPSESAVAETARKPRRSILAPAGDSPAAKYTGPLIENGRRRDVASDTCQVCGTSPEECPTVMCAPCGLVASTHADMADPEGGYEAWSPKRLAWSFGCAAKGSDLELKLYRALRIKLRTLQAECL